MKKIIVIQSIAIVVLLFMLFDAGGQKTKIETIEKTIVECDTFYKTVPFKYKKAIVKIPSQDGKKQVEKEVTQYVYKDTLKNGLLTSTILANKIYQRDIKLKTFSKEITRNIKKTVSKNRFYIGGSTSIAQEFEVKTISMNGYLSTDKILIGSGFGVDMSTQKPIIPLTIAFKF